MIKGKFSTNLIGLNDLLLGKGNQLQERWGSLKEVSKITLLQPLSNFNELKALDTSKFYYAMVTGKFSEADELAGYFYYFDCESIEAENLPLIVAPNKGVGRWKVIPYALDKIKAYVEDRLNQYIVNELPELAQVEVTKQGEIIAPIIFAEIIEPLLPLMVEEALADSPRITTSFTRGSYFNPDLTYPSSNYNDVFLRDTNNSLVKRTYLATENTNESPVTGAQSSSENGVTIYSNNAVLQENRKYKRVKYDNVTRYRINIADSTTFTFSPSTLIQIKDFYGTMTFKLYGAGSAKPICSFDIQFFTENDVKFNNVFYDNHIRQRSLGVDSKGYLAFGGFCFVNVLDGESLKGCLYIDQSFRWLYTYMEVESTTDFTIENNFAEILTPTILMDCFAVRPNGGSEIADMGIIYPSLRKRDIGSDTGYESYDYYLFKNGFIAWHEAIVLPTYYTQYHAHKKFAALNIDPSDCVIRGTGSKAGYEVGIVQQPQLPNITGKLGMYKDSNTTNYVWPTGGAESAYKGGFLQNVGFVGAFDNEYTPPNMLGPPSNYTFFKNLNTPTRGDINMPRVTFDASRSHRIYTAGGEVRMKSLVAATMVRVF